MMLSIAFPCAIRLAKRGNDIFIDKAGNNSSLVKITLSLLPLFTELVFIRYFQPHSTRHISELNVVYIYIYIVLIYFSLSI